MLIPDLGEKAEVVLCFEVRVGPFQKIPFFMTVEHGDFSVDAVLKGNAMGEIFGCSKHEMGSADKARVNIHITFGLN